MVEPDDTCNPAEPPSDWEVLSMSASSHTPSSAKTGATGSENPSAIVRGQDPQTFYLHENGPVCKEPDADTLRQTDPFVAPSQKVESADSPVGLSSATPVGADQARRKTSGRSRRAEVVCTIAVAATIVGIFFLGRRLRAELFQIQQLQLELSIKDEKLDNLTRQVASLKDVLNRHHTPRSSTF